MIFIISKKIGWQIFMRKYFPVEELIPHRAASAIDHFDIP